MLTEYLSVLSGAAAALVAPPEVPSTALRGPPALPYALEALRGAALEDGSTTVASLVEAVALIASNLACNNSVTGQCERSFDRITDALSQCFCQLPLTISTAEMAECVHRAEDRLAAPRELMLMPRVALQTVLTLLAKDVTPAAAPPYRPTVQEVHADAALKALYLPATQAVHATDENEDEMSP